MHADVGGGHTRTGNQEQQVSPAIMSLAQQILQMETILGPHPRDLMVVVPMGAVLRPTLQQLSSDNSTLLNHQLHFTPWEMDMVGSLLFAGMMTVVFPAGWLVGRFGRRLPIICGCFPLVIGWFFIYFANHGIFIFVGR
ncbi:hypothetical protein E2C01_063381 [Portunus trituberculatus]|uniref:Major facilitator superfamily (MFS) profile domain-containing protein n=1 Tax=Portunus trituberculatus TaxID=210409 RepID=A0A5B7HGX0_PORTR|nr:hypothetical protein [Portunus trituberculatus]